MSTLPVCDRYSTVCECPVCILNTDNSVCQSLIISLFFYLFKFNDVKRILQKSRYSPKL